MANSTWFADRRGGAVLRALAAIFCKEGNEAVHRLVARRINHGAAIAADGDQSSEAQPVEMECQGVRREAELFSHLPCRHAFRPGLDQQTEDFQTVFLRKRGQGRHGIYRFHISTSIELICRSQAAARHFFFDAVSPFRLQGISPGTMHLT
jgi:hypothetical protein